jgi:kynurenine formamidase
MSHRWIDLSHPLSVDTPPFPGDPPVEIDILNSTAATDDSERESLNCSRISCCIHCGTHMDAPFHFFGNGLTMERVPLDACCGSAVVIDLRGRLDDGPNATIDDGSLSACYGSDRQLPARVILRTDWEHHWGDEDYFRDHPVITRAAARWLVARHVRLVGVDFPSVDRAPYEAHLELLGNGVLIVENLTNLGGLADEQFEFIATPLAIVGRDGSPVRAVARVMGM